MRLKLFLSSRADGPKLDVAKRSLGIVVVIFVGARAVRLVIHPGHLAAVNGIAPQGEGEDHLLETCRHVGH